MLNQGTLRVVRPAGSYRDGGRAYRIVLDGRVAGEIWPGEERLYQVPRGEHVIEARIDWTGSPQLTVDVSNGDIVNVVVEPAGSAITAVFDAVFRKRRYLALRLES